MTELYVDNYVPYLPDVFPSNAAYDNSWNMCTPSKLTGRKAPDCVPPIDDPELQDFEPYFTARDNMTTNTPVATVYPSDSDTEKSDDGRRTSEQTIQGDDWVTPGEDDYSSSGSEYETDSSDSDFESAESEESTSSR